MKQITMGELIDKYETILFDAFGVLVDGHGRLPGSKELIDHLEAIGKSYFIVSNGSKFTPEMTAKSYLRRGLNVPVEKVITSGGLLKTWIAKNNLQGKKIKILGPSESQDLGRWSEAIPVDVNEMDYEALVLCNQDGFDFLPTMESILTEIYHKAKDNNLPKLLLLNPDIIYPKKEDKLGFTTGSMALWLEHALSPLFPQMEIKFEKLGKPYAPIFKEAITQAKQPKKKIVMIGDQMATDILGAKGAGLDSVITSFGITDVKNLDSTKTVMHPEYVLHSLAT